MKSTSVSIILPFMFFFYSYSEFIQGVCIFSDKLFYNLCFLLLLISILQRLVYCNVIMLSSYSQLFTFNLYSVVSLFQLYFFNLEDFFLEDQQIKGVFINYSFFPEFCLYFARIFLFSLPFCKLLELNEIILSRG